MYRIINGTIKEVERELNKIDKGQHRLQVLIMNTYTRDDKPRLNMLVHIGD